MDVSDGVTFRVREKKSHLSRGANDGGQWGLLQPFGRARRRAEELRGGGAEVGRPA